MYRIDEIGELRKDFVSGMARWTTILARIRRILSELAAAMARMDTINREAPIGLSEIAAGLRAMQRAIEPWRDRIDGIIADHHPERTADAMSGLARLSLEFRVVASLAAVQIAREQTGELASFVTDLRVMPDRIDAQTGQAATDLRLFTGVASAIRVGLDEASLHISDCESWLGRELAQIADAASEAETATGHQFTHAREAESSIRQQMERLVTAIQFSDFGAQRLEHVESILSRPGVSKEAQSIARAQLVSLAEDAEVSSSEIASCFSRMNILTDEVIAGLNKGREVTSTFLDRKRQTLQTAAETFERLKPSLLDLGQQSRQMSERIDQLMARLERLDDVGLTIKLAAMNARIKASRTQLVRRELGFIAETVNESSSRSRQLIETAAQGLGAIRSMGDGPEAAVIRTTVDDFETILQELRQVLEGEGRIQAALWRLSTEMGIIVDGMKEIVETGGSAIEGMKFLISLMRDFAASLPKVPVEAASVADLVNVYTMEKERQIHAEQIGEPYVPDATPQDLESILF